MRSADHYSFTVQRCSVGTTLLDSTFSPALDCFSDTASGIACENLYVFSSRRSVPCLGTPLLFYAVSTCHMKVRHAHSPAKNALFPLRSKSTFLSVSLRITHLGRFAYSLSIYLSISLSTTGIFIVFSFNAFTPSAIKSPIRTKFNTTSMAARIEYAPVRYR